MNFLEKFNPFEAPLFTKSYLEMQKSQKIHNKIKIKDKLLFSFYCIAVATIFSNLVAVKFAKNCMHKYALKKIFLCFDACLLSAIFLRVFCNENQLNNSHKIEEKNKLIFKEDKVLSEEDKILFKDKFQVMVFVKINKNDNKNEIKFNFKNECAKFESIIMQNKKAKELEFADFLLKNFKDVEYFSCYVYDEILKIQQKDIVNFLKNKDVIKINNLNFQNNNFINYLSSRKYSEIDNNNYLNFSEKIFFEKEAFEDKAKSFLSTFDETYVVNKKYYSAELCQQALAIYAKLIEENIYGVNLIKKQYSIKEKSVCNYCKFKENKCKDGCINKFVYFIEEDNKI